MTKRISCFLLAFVMVFLAVPVFALSALAVEKPYAAAWSANMPVVVPSTGLVDYKGAWYIGNKANATSFTRFVNYAPAGGESAKLIAVGTADQWTNGGCYVGGYAGGESRALIVPSGKTVSVRYIAEYTGAATVYVDDIVFYGSGTANISMALLLNGKIVWPAGAAYDDVNTWFNAGSTVKPNNAASLVNETLEDVSMNLEQGDAVEFVFRRVTSDSWGCYGFDPVINYADVSGQDRLAKTSSYISDVKWNVAGASPMTYSDWVAAQEEGADTSAAAYGTYFQDFGILTFVGRWTNGVVNPSTRKYEKVARRYFFADRLLNETTSWDWEWIVTESAWQAGLKTYLGGVSTSSPWNTNYGAMRQDHKGCTQPSTTSSTFYSYTYESPVEGVVSFSFDSISSPTSDMYLAVLVDGCMVWPSANQALTTNQCYKVEKGAVSPADAVNASLASVTAYVDEGSLVQFVVAKGGWAGCEATGNGYVLAPAITLMDVEEDKSVIMYYGKNGEPLSERHVLANGAAFPAPPTNLATWDFNADGVADELPATVNGSLDIYAVTFYGKDSYLDDHPTVGDANATVFYGDWTIGKGTWSGADLTATGLTWTFDSLFSKYSSPAFVTGKGGEGLWDGPGGGVYLSDGKIATKNPTNGVAVIYTVPVSGYVDLGFDVLRGSREIGSNDERYNQEGTLAYYVSIVKNGKVIWPSEGSAHFFESDATYTGSGQKYDYLTASHPEFPTSLLVAEGDEIAFVANMGNSLSWMLYMEPVVTYTALVTNPSVSTGSVTLNSAFSANFGIQMENVPAGSVLGAYINDEFVAAVDGEVTLADIAAKDIADDITVVPACAAGDTVLKGDVIVYSVADLLKDYINGEYDAEVKALAAATLNYAAAAQKYFAPETADEDLANYGVDVDVVVNGTYESALDFAGEAAENVATPYSATLLLNDEVALKFIYVNAVADFATNYEFVLIKDSEIVKRATPVLCEGQTTTYKVIFEGIMPNAWNVNYTVGVVAKGETEVIGETVTYSVISYLARMQNHASVKDVVAAMLALYEATV